MVLPFPGSFFLEANPMDRVAWKERPTMRLTYKAVREAALAQGRTVADAAAYLGIHEDSLGSAQHDVTFGHRQGAEAILSGHWAPPEPCARRSASASHPVAAASSSVGAIPGSVEQQPLPRLKIQQGAPDSNDEATSRLKHFVPSAAPGRPPVEAGGYDAAGSASDTNVELEASVPSDDGPGGGEFKPAAAQEGGPSNPVQQAASKASGVPEAAVRTVGSRPAAAKACEITAMPQIAEADEDGWVVENMANIKPAAQEWLWPSRIPIGEVTLIVGSPGTGKSQIAAYMAARVSTGGEWPDAAVPAPKGMVLLLDEENNPHTVLRPRLMAAEADLSKVHIVRGGQGGQHADLGSPMKDLRRELERRPGVRLVIVDTFDAFVPGLNINQQQHVRPVMAALQAVAVEFGVAIVLIAHLNKRRTKSASGRVAGAMALEAAARTVIVVGKDYDGNGVMVPLKQNLSAAAGLAFRIANGARGDIPSSYVDFLPEPVEMSASALLAMGESGADPTRSEESRAKDLLLRELAAGPQPSRMMNLLATEEGLSARTMERARRALGVQASKGRDAMVWLPGTAVDPNTANAAKVRHMSEDGGIGGIHVSPVPEA